MNEADRNSEDVMFLRVWKEHEQERRRREQEKTLLKMLQGATEAEREKILADFRDYKRRLQTKQEDQKLRHNDKLAAKVEARKRMREQLDRDKAVNRELDHITTTHAAKGDNESAEVITNISRQLNGVDLTADQEALLQDQLARMEALELQHRQQQHQADQEMDEELARQRRAIDEQINQQKKLVGDSQKETLERELLLRGDKLSDEEYKKLMAKHKQEQEAIERNLESEHQRQTRTLQDKINERRQKRTAQDAEKHSLDMEEEAIKQQQERDKLNEKLAKQVENTTLKDSVKGKDGQKAENMIYTVLRQRHMKEAIHLEDQLAKLREAALRQRLAEIEQQRQAERDRLLSAFEQEMFDLVGNAGSMSNEELTARKEELKRQQQRQLNDFDNLTTQLITRAEKEVQPKQEIEDTNARLELKEKQLKEIAEAMRNYSPVDELRKKYELHAREAKDEMEKYKHDVYKKMQAELEKRKADQKKREEERKQKMIKQMKQLEKELEEDHCREAERQKERAAEKERIRQQQVEERDRREREEIMMANMSAKEKKRLLKEHEKNMEKLNENMKQEQSQSKKSLVSKLEARRKRRQQAEMAKLEKTAQLDADDELKNELRRSDEVDTLLGLGRMNDGATKGKGSKNGDGGLPTPPFSGFSPSGNAEQDWVNLLMASPLFKQINDLEQMLAKSDASSAGSSANASDKVHGADYSKAYIDVKDAQWICKGDLVPTDINSLGPSQFVIYRFGVFLIRLLHHNIGTPEVTLLLASNLPPNNYTNNAFRNSIFYQHAKNILFVRRERMDSIGEFVMVVLHSLAHIKVGDLTDDANVQFLRVFYKAMKVVCQDMFFSRSRSSPAVQGMLGSGLTSARPVLEQALTGTMSPDDRTNTIGELINMRVEAPTSMDFSDQRMSQRLYGYEAVASNARLRQQLSAKGGYLPSGDFISSRMAELKGSPTHSPRSPSRRQRVPAVQSPRDLLDSQIVSLRAKSDVLNTELLQVLKLESELRQGMQKTESSPGSQKVTELQQQLTNAQIRKEDIVRQSVAVEEEIRQKEKALKTRRK